ncbi:sulfotransferase family protein [Amaricoccus sp.]|uniref:sulfotransferase family protein n=1 Tax=Amaricoccus sp. TaxID=1872485 RepID=UPI001B5124FD|nr:sulfotransferase family protein [Amaricoccus sp.]MBP7001775.1 sulfotransferase family protein [Amaricoccus sp.]
MSGEAPARRVRALGRFLRRPYYVLRPRLWGQPLPILDDRSMVSRAGRYVYLRVPKAANSTVFRALAERFPEPGVSLDDLAAAKTRVTHLGDLRLRDLPALRGYLIFTVVRDPYARTLSAYLNKFREGDKHLDRFGERVAGFDGGRVSFRGFCRYLAAGGEAENAHWMRQTRITGLADRLDIVGRVETLDADLARILAAIGAPGGAVERAGPPPTGATARIAEHYDAETRRIVEAVYAADFAAFGYPRLGG